jgi:hypothetical protein
MDFPCFCPYPAGEVKKGECQVGDGKKDIEKSKHDANGKVGYL